MKTLSKKQLVYIYRVHQKKTDLPNRGIKAWFGKRLRFIGFATTLESSDHNKRL